MLEFLHQRPISTMCLLLMVVCLSGYGLGRLELGGAVGGDHPVFEVTIEHFGIDSREIERSIARPLEEALGSMQGIAELRSVSEYSNCRLTIECLDGVKAADFYLDLRDVVDRVYRLLPSSVQKPQVRSSDSRQAAIFIMSLEAPAKAAMGASEFQDWVDREVKPAFEREPGVGEVEIGGGQLREVQILLDTPRAQASGISATAIADALRSQDCLLPAGRLQAPGNETMVVVAGHLESLDALRQLPVPSTKGSPGLVLGDVAKVVYGQREAQRLSRLDGEHKLLVYIHPAGSANPIQLSQTLRAQSTRLTERGLQVEVILDSGREMENALLQTIGAMLEGLVVILLILPFFLGSLRQLVGMAIMIPLALLVSLALFSAIGISLDPPILAGIAIGLGSILDTCILVVEQPDWTSFRRLVPALAASLLTVLAVLVPLSLVGALELSLRDMALAIIIILVVTFSGSLLFLPSLAGIGAISQHLEPDSNSGLLGSFAKLRNKVASRWGRSVRRLFAWIVLFSAHHPKSVIVGSLGLCLATTALVWSAGLDLVSLAPSSAIAVHVEFSPQASLESIDRRMGEFSLRLRRLPGIARVESLTRAGSAEMTVIPDSAGPGRPAIMDLIREQGRSLADAFVYLPEAEDHSEMVFQLSIMGDDNDALRTLAQQTAGVLQSQAWIRQVVLNFKPAPQELALRIDRNHAAAYGLSISDIQSTVRWNLWGPVALKWLDGSKERDVRVMDQAARRMTRSSLLSLPAVGNGPSTVRLGSVTDMFEQSGSSKIYRKNRQRVVFLTIHALPQALEKTEACLDMAMAKIKLPSGYVYEMDRHLRETQENAWRLAIFMAASLLFIYMVLAFQSQSWGVPILVLSIVPVSLAVPLLGNALGGHGISIPIILGCIILAGVVVNNSILVIDGLALDSRGVISRGMGIRLAYQALRNRIKALMVTATATLIGCFPLLLAASATTGFMNSLSWVILWGVVGGLLATLVTLPAVLARFPRLLVVFTFRPRNILQELP